MNTAESESFDVIVVGDGPGGDFIARRLGRAGKRVAIVEREALGGECLNWGCIPSKALINIARQRPYLPWSDVRTCLAKAIARIRGDEPDGGFRGDGVTLIRGEARIEPGAVVVDGERMAAGDIVIATGARPSLPPIPGLAESEPLTNRTMFELPVFPERFAVIGGGPVGLEIAQAMSLLGASVTIFEAETIANTEDEAIAGALRESFLAEGIAIVEQLAIDRVFREGTAFFVETGGERARFDSLLVAAGRSANVPCGFAESGGMLTEAGAVQADSCGRTSLPGAWAIGDVTGGPGFTHHATHQAHHVAVHLAEGRCPGNREPVVPWAIFTTPEVGHVGITEAEARERHGGQVRVGEANAASLDWYRMAGETGGFARVITDGHDGRLLGAHFFCAQGSTLAGEAALAIQNGLTARQVVETIHPYPTAAELFRTACAKALD